jgi:hypothetical protein
VTAALASELNDLGDRLASARRFAEAEESYLRALAIIRDTTGDRHPDAANVLKNLALITAAQGRHAECLEYAEDARAISTAYVELEAADDDDRAVLRVLAELHLACSGALVHALLYNARPEEALEVADGTLAFAERTYEAEAEELGVALENLALACAHTGRSERALASILRAKSILERARGGEDPSLHRLYSHLGTIYELAGDLRRAELFMRRALELHASCAPGDEHGRARMLIALAKVVHERGKYALVEELCRRAEKLIEGDAARSIALHELLEPALAAQCRFEEAERARRRLEALRSRS